MRGVIYHRDTGDLQGDDLEVFSAFMAGFHVIGGRSGVEKGDFVIPRYSALPFYRELVEDVHAMGGEVINSVRQHNYVIDLQNYCADLKELTFKTYDRIQDAPEGAYVVKGATNSMKGQWKRKCFAPTKADATQIYNLLSEDGLIGQQQIYLREYVPLFKYGEDVQGMPITKEFRFFIYKGKVLSGGFYWSNHEDIVHPIPSILEVPQAFMAEVLERIEGRIDFVVVDVAQTATGEWVVVELNDGCMAGLSKNNPQVLYNNLYFHLREEGRIQ